MNIEINLGNEYDEDLIKAIKRVFKIVKARKKWFGNISTYDYSKYRFVINGSEIILEVETYIGITLSGKASLVKKLDDMIKDEM